MTEKSLLAPPFLSTLRKYQGPTGSRGIGAVSRLKKYLHPSA